MNAKDVLEFETMRVKRFQEEGFSFIRDVRSHRDSSSGSDPREGVGVGAMIDHLPVLIRRGILFNQQGHS